MNRGGTPFFFSNFPFDLKETDLWKIFRRWGRVSDVFISRRLNIKKQRFGFVRFQGVQNIRELENQLNTIWIGSWKLYANRPKYNKSAETRKEWNEKLKEKEIESEKVVKKEWRAKGTNSYANVVKNGDRNRAQSLNRANINAIHFKVEETPREWLKQCYIGRVSDLSKVSSLNESFILGGLSYIKVKFLGGFHVLLMGENETKVKEAIEENKEWFEDLFDTIIPWEDQFVAVDKLVWVRCRGLPLKLWNTECFKHIAALLGTLVEVDEATMTLDELEYARFKVRVSVGCEAKITSYMRINEVLYQISVEEECTVPEYNLCQCHGGEISDGDDSEVDSMASHASGRSENGAFEDARKIEEEEKTVETSKTKSPLEQDRRRSEPLSPLHCCDPFPTKLLGATSAPNLCLLTKKENIGPATSTAISRADKAKKNGLLEMAQCVSNQTQLADAKRRCKLKNHFESDSNSSPINGRVEDSVWIGSLGSPLNMARINDLEEVEQIGKPWNESAVALRAHGRSQKDIASAHHAQNEAAITLQSHTVEETEEKRNQIPHTLNLAVQKERFLSNHAQSSVGEETVREAVSMLSISKVEDSLCTTPLGV